MRSRGVAATQEYRLCLETCLGLTTAADRRAHTADPSNGFKGDALAQQKLCQLLQPVVQHRAPLAGIVRTLMRNRAVAAKQKYQLYLKAFLGRTVAAQRTTNGEASGWRVSEGRGLPPRELCKLVRNLRSLVRH